MAPDYGKMKIAELKEHWLRESIGLERALARREYWLGESMGSDSENREPVLCAVRDCLVPVWPGPDKIAPKINK